MTYLHRKKTNHEEEQVDDNFDVATTGSGTIACIMTCGDANRRKDHLLTGSSSITASKPEVSVPLDSSHAVS